MTSQLKNKVKIIIYLKKGVSSAFNKGIENATGKYLIFLNSDDYFYDNKVLKDSYDFLTANENLDWIYGKINTVEVNDKSTGVFPTKKIFQISSRFLLKFIRKALKLHGGNVIPSFDYAIYSTKALIRQSLKSL